MSKKPRKKKRLPIPLVLELLRLRIFSKPQPEPRALRVFGVIGYVGPDEEHPRKGA
jgi:hypothetical protein